MGKKRTHAETKDGFTKPPPPDNPNRVTINTDRKDKRDKRKNGDDKKRKAVLVRYDTMHPAPQIGCVAN
jgi:ribosome biogenesis protein MAK21